MLLCGAALGRIVAVRIFLCPSLAPADAGRSKFSHTITMASLACEIGKSVRICLAKIRRYSLRTADAKKSPFGLNVALFALA